MNIIIETLLFFAGVHFMILLLASCYRVIDLWYCIGNHWKDILATIIALGIFNAFIVFMLPEEFKAPWVWGQVCYLSFHVVIFWIGRLGLWIAEMKQR
ncbi:MAG: hypothetical protein JJ934_02065 [Pseudomonadales bacterium]|nr:hypothetical protein [Pseudomonadales bacterium]MBO6563769.1 hypothetical protein [Pseudomonadales bacterium]MBO6595578.1 hypothetical protein [Pseudomonadales bacterium]MBO6655647.1 hypothetical protein [Pseudomonadales bacterium]MBO6702078.1 hypothetical protein [Pseudomonadales bacterium]